MLLLLSLVKFQANEQEAELELEVGPENDDGQAEKWRGNVVVVGVWGGSCLRCPDQERTQDSRAATVKSKNTKGKNH